MGTNNFFNIKRLYHLIIRNLRLYSHSVLIVTGAASGFIIISVLINLIFNTNSYDTTDFLGLSLPVFMIGGYLLTSFAFSELHAPHKSCFYLTLPVSTFERLISAWLISTIGYIIYAICCLYAINIFTGLLNLLFIKTPFSFYNLFTPNALQTYGVYIVTQSIFLFGSVYFRKANFFKTMLSLFLVTMVISVYATVMIHLIINPHSHVWGFDTTNTPESVKLFFVEQIYPVLKILFWYFTIPLFLILSYIRLKERQV